MKVAIVGAGGNIGSPLVHNVVQHPEVTGLLLVDRDLYEAKNLTHQGISPADVGCAKAAVQQTQARTLRPELPVEAYVADVQALPAGLFLDCVVLGAVDNRAARQYLNALSRHLGLPYVDGAVSARDGHLISRVTVLPGSATGACLECSWGEAQYADLEHVYPCGGDTPEAPTNAPAALGALTAARMCLELRHWGGGTPPADACSIYLDCAADTCRKSRLKANPRCRLAHDRWDLTPLPVAAPDCTVGELLAGQGARALALPGTTFVDRLTCVACRARVVTDRFATRIPRSRRRCATCGRMLSPVIGESREWLAANAEVAAKKLRDCGLTNGDVVALWTRNNTTEYRLVTLAEQQ